MWRSCTTTFHTSSASPRSVHSYSGSSRTRWPAISAEKSLVSKRNISPFAKSFFGKSSARWRTRSAKWYGRQLTFGAVRAVFHLTIGNGLSLSRSDNTTRLLVHSSTYRAVSNCYRPRSALRSAQIFRRRLHVLTARACLFVAQTLRGTEHTDCL